MSAVREKPEERIVRETIHKLLNRYGLEIMVMRNEANATTTMLRNCEHELKRVLSGFALMWAMKAVESAYQKLSPSIKFGLGVGSPDVVVCAWGRFVGLEFKAPKGRQGADQKSFEGAVDKAGGYYFLVRSPEDAIQALEFVRGQVGI